MEAEPDSDQEQDIDQVLGAWLGELENMTKQMDSDITDATLPTSPLPQPSYDILDNFRFSQFNLENQVSIGGSTEGASKTLQAMEEEDSQDVDLDALLGDLCEMELSLQEQIGKGPQPSTKESEAVSTVSPESQDTEPPPPPPPPPPQGEEDIGVFEDDLPPPPPTDDSLVECDSAPLPPPPPPTGDTDGHTEHIPSPPPPAPPLPPNLNEQVSSKPVPQSLSLSVSSSNSSTNVSESTHDDTVSLDSTRTASTHSIPSPKQGTESQVHVSFNQTPLLEVTPSSPAPTALSPKSPKSPSIQSPPANLSKSVRVKLKEIEDQLENDPSLSEEERQAKIKAEKIKIALEKLKKANIQKLIVRVYTDDGSSKTVFLDDTMTCRGATAMMIEKNHLEYKPELAILEQVPDLYMERIVEDHENLVNDVLMNWKRETTNRILFSERKEKYAIFRNPQNYLLSTSSSQAAQQFAEKSKEVLIKEFFSDTGSQIPEVEGVLWMKAEGKKSWKRFYFILRASGLYFSPKGKSKSSKDLICLVGFEHNNVYHGVSWKKKYKAPTDHCFAIKHPQLQQKSKYIKYLCAEDYRSCQRWIAGIRLAKYGRQLLLNYNQTQKELTEYKVRQLSQNSSSNTNGMADTISLSSLHSTVSSHSSSSGSLRDSKSLSIYQPTQVLPLHANAPMRRGTVGNMFANAWKKGLETDGKSSNVNTEVHRPAIVTPTKSKRPSETLNEFEVQKALQELEFDLDMSNKVMVPHHQQPYKPQSSAPESLANLFVPPSPKGSQNSASPPSSRSSLSATPKVGQSPRTSTCSSSAKMSPCSSVSSATSVHLLQSKQAQLNSPPPTSSQPVPNTPTSSHLPGNLTLQLTQSSLASPPTSPRERSPRGSPTLQSPSGTSRPKRPIPVQPPTVPVSFRNSQSPVEAPSSPVAHVEQSNQQYYLVNPMPQRKSPSPVASPVVSNQGNIFPNPPLTPNQKRNSLNSPTRQAPPPPPVRSPTTKLVNRLSGSEEQFVYGNLGGKPEQIKRVQFRDSCEEIPKGSYDYDSEGSSLSSSSPNTCNASYGRPNFEQMQAEQRQGYSRLQRGPNQLQQAGALLIDGQYVVPPPPPGPAPQMIMHCNQSQAFPLSPAEGGGPYNQPTNSPPPPPPPPPPPFPSKANNPYSRTIVPSPQTSSPGGPSNYDRTFVFPTQRRSDYDTLVRTSVSDSIPGGPPQAFAFPRQPSPTRVAPSFLNELNDALIRPKSPNSYNNSPQGPPQDPGRPPVMRKPTKSKPTSVQTLNSSPKRAHSHVGVPGKHSPSSPYSPSNSSVFHYPPGHGSPKKSQNPHGGPQRQSLPTGAPPPVQARSYHSQSLPNSPPNSVGPPNLRSPGSLGPPVQPKPNKHRQSRGPKPPAPPRVDIPRRQSDYV